MPSARRYLVIMWTNYQLPLFGNMSENSFILFLILFLLNLIHYSFLIIRISVFHVTFFLLLKIHYNFWYTSLSYSSELVLLQKGKFEKRTKHSLKKQGKLPASLVMLNFLEHVH